MVYLDDIPHNPQVSRFDDVAGLAGDLVRLGAKVVGIDGHPGAGKSHLAAELAKRLNGHHLKLDDLVNSKQGQYVAELRVKEIQCELEGAIRPVLFDGICNLAAADRINKGINSQPLVFDAFVYVCRIAGSVWYDDLYHRQQTSELYNGLDAEIVAYNFEWLPLKRATHLFLRQEWV